MEYPNLRLGGTMFDVRPKCMLAPSRESYSVVPAGITMVSTPMPVSIVTEMGV